MGTDPALSSVFTPKSSARENHSELKGLLLLTAIFFCLILLIALNRYYTLFVSYDHGLFSQLFWNSLHGNLFQSSLSSGNSVGVLQDGHVPTAAYFHLGQHFVPDFLLWVPVYALFPTAVTLVILQVGLMTAGGLVLYALARHYLQPRLALLITAAYFGAGAVIAITLGEFYEQCQVPLFVFGLLLALEKQRWWLFWLLTACVLGIREDSGFILFGIGLYLLLSRRYPALGGVLCGVSFTYFVVITNIVMPQFSDDSSRLYLATHFKSFVGNNPHPSTLQVLKGILTHPGVLLSNLLNPPSDRAFFLLTQWTPLVFIPALSASAWVLAGIPLLSMLVQNSLIGTDMGMRYSLAVIPGIFYGTILWWSAHPNAFKSGVRYFWIGCIALSVVLTVYANPNQAFYFLNSRSCKVAVPFFRYWEHANHVRQLLAKIPADASISATTYLIPPLSPRRELLRLPTIAIQTTQGHTTEVDYLVADLWRLEYSKHRNRGEYARLEKVVLLLDQVVSASTYGVREVKDRSVLLQKGTASKPGALADWLQLRQELPRVEPSNWVERT